MKDVSLAYAACPHCSGPVNVTRIACGAAIDVLVAVRRALDDSAVKDARAALESIIAELRASSGGEIMEALWPFEELARKAAVAAQQPWERDGA